VTGLGIDTRAILCSRHWVERGAVQSMVAAQGLMLQRLARNHTRVHSVSMSTFQQ